MKLTIKMFLFVSVFAFFGVSSSFGQSNLEIIKLKLSEVKTQALSSSTTVQNGVPVVPLGGMTLEVMFYENLLSRMENTDPATAVQQAYKYVSKDGQNPKVLHYRNEAQSLLNL